MCVTRRFAEVAALGIIMGLIPSRANAVAADKEDAGTDTKTAFCVPLGQRQLFLDDFGIAEIEDLERTMHQPSKRGAVIRPSFPTETAVQTRCAPAWDSKEKVFKIWYFYSDRTEWGGLACAESKDGLHWTKIAADNVPLNPTIPTVRAPFNAVHDPIDPDPSRQYKGFGHAHGREPYVSANGIDWVRLNVPAIPSQDESNLSFDETEHLFIATVKQGGPYGRAIYLVTSKDFEHWTKPELIFHADELDQERGRANIKARFADPTLQQPSYNIPATYHVDVYNMGVFGYEGLYIGMPSMFHQTGKVPKDWPGFDDLPIPPMMLKAYRQSGDWSGFHDVQLACSRDLRNWKRLGDRKPFLGSSPLGSGAYDLACVLPPSLPIVRGDELWLYYTAGTSYGLVPIRTSDRQEFAICLAVLRRDGFISLDAGDEQGTILTEPFTVPGEKMLVNVDAFKGELCAEVLDKGGQIVAMSAPMKGDLLRGEVRWQTGGLVDLKGKEVSIRFRLRNATFYSYWFDEK